MFRYCFSSVILLLLIPFSQLSAKDINLDSIYIKKTSPEYKKLVVEKLEVYQKIGAEFADRDVIFADWLSGDEILYIKEIDSLKTNYVCRYRLSDRKNIQLCKTDGIVTIAKLSPDKKFIVLKKFAITRPGQIIPAGETLIIDAATGSSIKLSSTYAFLDFSISPDSGSLLLENEKGIAEYNIAAKKYQQILDIKKYTEIKISDNPCIAQYSPDKQNMLIMNGGGGNYNAKVLTKNREIKIPGISISAEVFWLDNYSIVFSTGYSGNYSIVTFNINDEKINYLTRNSFNTNLCYSAHPKIISFLKEQVILLYDRSEKELINTGIEGEDISFDPNGNRFISLLYKKLFIVNLNTAGRKRIELSRSWKKILSIYNDLRKMKKYHENQYSGIYISRKIKVYSDLADM